MNHSISPDRLAVCSLTLEQLAEAAWVFGLTLDVALVPRAPEPPAPPLAPAPSPALSTSSCAVGFDEALAA